MTREPTDNRTTPSTTRRMIKRTALGLIAGAAAYGLITVTMGTVLPFWWGVPLMSVIVGIGAGANWEHAGPLISAVMAYGSLDYVQNLEHTAPLYGFVAATIAGLVCLFDELNDQ